MEDIQCSIDTLAVLNAETVCHGICNQAITFFTVADFLLDFTLLGNIDGIV